MTIEVSVNNPETPDISVDTDQPSPVNIEVNVPEPEADISISTIIIPTVFNGTLTISENSTALGTFSANQANDTTIDVTVPTKLTDLDNDLVGDATISFTSGDEVVGSFTTNASENVTIELPESSGGSSRNVGEIVTSTIPLIDAGLHLLDGSLLQYGSYKDFIDYMAGLYEDDPTADYFVQPEITYINETSDGTAITSGDYTGSQDKSYAFDGNTSTGWGSSQLGSSAILGVAYIGKSGLSYPVKKVKMFQGYPSQATNYCTGFKFQYSNDGTTWIDIDTVTGGVDKTWQEWILPDYTPSGATHSFRVLANEGFSGTTANNWIVDELELYYQTVKSAEEVWQTAVTTYGVCGKFVYDSTNNTVRLPKRTTEHGALIKSYSSGADWYRIYQDGWCEQGGTTGLQGDNSYTRTTITFLKPFANTNYTITSSPNKYSTQNGIGSAYPPFIYTKNTNTCIFGGFCWTDGFDWQACGYIDISDYQYSPIYEYLVVANSTKTEIEVDIDEVMTDLNGKADKDLSNLDQSVYNEITKLALPGTTYANYSVQTSGHSYTAIDDGFITVASITGGIYVAIRDSNDEILVGNASNFVSGFGALAFIPIRKNQTFTVHYTNSLVYIRHTYL